VYNNSIMKNTLLYNASVALVKTAMVIKQLGDMDYANELLDKAEYYKNQIVIDEKQEEEILDYAERIKQGL